MSDTLTFGACFACATSPAARGSLWGHIAVVNRPGVPIVVDRDCPRNSLYFIQGFGKAVWNLSHLNPRATAVLTDITDPCDTPRRAG